MNVSHHYKELGIPYVRLHDTNWPNPKEVDVHTIFTDFSKDAADPDNYDFLDTDEYIKSVHDVGAKIIYRLGTSIEHAWIKHHTKPPADFQKWAQICIGIIRHYNEGWANGFHYDMKYWEIWNEPDNGDGDCMWSGTDQQYYDLYKIAALEMKRHDPSLKIGGFAAATGASDFMKGFIKFCEQNNLPLDFFSWHAYPSNPNEIASTAYQVKIILDAHGYADVEIHLNEWNYMATWEGVLSRTGGENKKREVFEKLKGIEGAAFSGCVFSLLQNLPVDMANYYDGQSGSWWSGLFDNYGVPLKTYYAFKAFKELYECGEGAITAVSPEHKGVYCLAAKKENAMQAVIMISGFQCQRREYDPLIDGLRENMDYLMETYLLNREKNLEFVGSHMRKGSQFDVHVFLEEYSLMLVKITGI